MSQSINWLTKCNFPNQLLSMKICCFSVSVNWIIFEFWTFEDAILGVCVATEILYLCIAYYIKAVVFNTLNEVNLTPKCLILFVVSVNQTRSQPGRMWTNLISIILLDRKNRKWWMLSCLFLVVVSSCFVDNLPHPPVHPEHVSVEAVLPEPLAAFIPWCDAHLVPAVLCWVLHRKVNQLKIIYNFKIDELIMKIVAAPLKFPLWKHILYHYCVLLYRRSLSVIQQSPVHPQW